MITTGSPDLAEGGKGAAGAAKGRDKQVNPGRRWPLKDTRKFGLSWDDTS
jgi:hypothetical protein